MGLHSTENGFAIFKLGPWRVNPATGELSRAGERVQLEPRVMGVLAYLAEHGGRFVPKEELLDQVWRDTAVTDHVLWRCVSRLRKVLGDDPRDPTFIETLPKRGYRLRVGVSFGSGPPNAPARRLYETGVSLYRRRRWSDNCTAIELLQRAVDGEPDFAPARAQLAMAYATHWMRFHGDAADGRWARAALEEARRAVALDAELPQAHLALGLAYRAQGELRPAATAYNEALRRDPACAEALGELGALYASAGRIDRAVQHCRLAGPTRRTTLAGCYRLLGDLARARSTLATALEIDPGDLGSLALACRLDLQQQRFEDARATAARMLDSDPRSVRALETAATVDHVTGDLRSARRRLELATEPWVSGGNENAVLRRFCLLWSADRERAEDMQHRLDKWRLEAAAGATAPWWPDVCGAVVLGTRGDSGPALALMERALRRGYVDHAWLVVDPVFSGLRDDPAFDRLVARIQARVRRMSRSARCD